jgi:3-dehydroquinate dehydratase
LFVDGNGESSLTINTNKQTIISHHYHQQTNNHLSPLTSTNKQSYLTITINKQTIISHHYHQQTNWWEMTVCLLRIMVRVDCLFVDVNGERWLFVDGNGERWLFGCCC